ncbi:uncharacterized protein BXZ73DRAFT_97737 [Epithele typhae]|uniref:uncharacterized protein n=1 Tax=Epithele typhae TaxID=378194 RepID=UPI0020075404|nr:uncharacterized protein BXZ73DRAFT_97737 [Epithele typhae]KAH9942324.1 hypothetical protein BXZ73DRAFT_97737 [Epithele typhae]
MLTASRRPSTLDAWLARWGLLDWLRLLWCAAVLWFELASFLWALRTCSWPDSALSLSHERPAHVLLVADPQVKVPLPSNFVGSLSRWISDLTLRRHWFFASGKNPDVVVFLGDILASWRTIRTDEEYEIHYRKFMDLFGRNRRVPSYFVPGNNDVGLNIDPTAARQARLRFTKHFGPLNQMISIRNHTLVMVDAPGLVEEDYIRAAKSTEYKDWTPKPHGPVEFIQSLRQANESSHTVLFSHIPLYRPDTASCGPLREKGTIRRGAGSSYQNTLGKKTSTYMLQTLNPQMVFSADDKDYCDYIHVPPRNIGSNASTTSEDQSESSRAQKVREVTLKAFSPSTGIHYPGFQLLSLATPTSVDRPFVSTNACFFPDYPSIYAWRYLPLFLLTAITLVVLRQRKLKTPHHLPTHHRRSTLAQSFSISSLPIPSWTQTSHPPTPFTQDWAPSTPGFFRSRTPGSPTDAFPKDSLRAPTISRSVSGTSTHARDGSLSGALPTGPAHLDADELEDEFAYGRYDQRVPFRPKEWERGPGGDSHADDYPFPHHDPDVARMGSTAVARGTASRSTEAWE